MPVSDLGARLADVLKAQHPLAECWPCLARKIRVDQGRLRDAAQLLLVAEREAFVLAHRSCATCGAADEVLVYVTVGRL